MTTANRFRRAASLADLEGAGRLTVQLGAQVILLVHHEGNVYAVDNRCPHMGFPLARGSVAQGILTCHWHHARFDLCSGGTFDPFADDVRTYPVRLEGDEVLVDPTSKRDERAYGLTRLQDGLEQNLRLVLAKTAIGLDDLGVDAAALLETGGLFGATQRDAGWRDGLTIFTAMGNLLPDLAPEDRPLALYHGLLHVAANVDGQAPHYPLEPLPGGPHAPARLGAWLREFAEVRDREGVERVILSALDQGVDDRGLAGMLVTAATDHAFLDNGHSLDFINKAFELLDRIGWRHAPAVLPSLVPALTAATRMEETSAWRTPVDLAALVEPVLADLVAGKLGPLHEATGRLDDDAQRALVDTLLGDDPEAINQALVDAVTGGAALAELSLALAHAAALRVARFHTSNEFGDWIAVLHTLSSAYATHRLLLRAPSLHGARGLWHAAMDLYLNRFLNAPAARMPTDESVADEPEDGDVLLDALLDLGDRRQGVERSAALVWRYLALGHDDRALVRTLAHGLLREDGEFHSYQMLEAGVKLHDELAAARPSAARGVLVAVARYLAAHAPTDRATTQTYRIAARLHAGEALAAD